MRDFIDGQLKRHFCNLLEVLDEKVSCHLWIPHYIICIYRLYFCFQTIFTKWLFRQHSIFRSYLLLIPKLYCCYDTIRQNRLENVIILHLRKPKYAATTQLDPSRVPNAFLESNSMIFPWFSMTLALFFHDRHATTMTNFNIDKTHYCALNVVSLYLLIATSNTHDKSCNSHNSLNNVLDRMECAERQNF